MNYKIIATHGLLTKNYMDYENLHSVKEHKKSTHSVTAHSQNTHSFTEYRPSVNLVIEHIKAGHRWIESQMVQAGTV